MLKLGVAGAVLVGAMLGTQGFAKDQEQRSAEKQTIEKQIEQAQTLVLSNKRMEALKRLKSLVGSRAGQRDQRVERAAAEIVQMFLAEKANSQFAIAEAIWMNKPKEAMEILQTLMSAGSPEPAGNLRLPGLAARVAIRMNDCGRAMAMAKAAEAVWKTPEVFLLEIQAQDCQNDASPSAAEIKIPEGEELGEIAVPVKLVLIRDALRRKDLKTARAQLALVEAQAPDNPELWNLRWRAFSDRGDARRYLRLCSELTPKRRERFSLQPELCLAVESVESELKSGEKSGS